MPQPTVDHVEQMARELPEGDRLELLARLTRAREADQVPTRRSVHDFKPLAVSGLLRPYPDPDDDILGEMLYG